MLNLSATQAAMVAKASKHAIWVIYVYDKNGVGYACATASLNAISWMVSSSWDSGLQWNTSDELSTIVITGFSGIDLRRDSPESSVISPSEISFNISNKNNALTFSDFNGGEVLVQLVISDLVSDILSASWRFNIKSAEPGYQNIKINCEDFLHKYLRGDYPNTPLPEDVFPSNAGYEADHDGLCVPVPFGTAYVPLRPVYLANPRLYMAQTLSVIGSATGSRPSINDSASGLTGKFKPGTPITVTGFTNEENNGYFTPHDCSSANQLILDEDDGLVTEAAGNLVTLSQGDVYFMLGTDEYTYTINRIRSPRSIGDKSVWINTSTTFTQTDHADSVGGTWRTFQPFIADTDRDGVNESAGFWRPGDNLLDAPVRFTRSDTATMTNPADVIEFVLKDMGVPAARIDPVSFAAARATFTGWGLTFNGAFWYKQTREKVLSQLLNQCHSCIRVGEKVELHVLVKASRKTITAAEVLRKSDQGEGSFLWRDVLSENYSNCGYVAWQKDYEAQDSFLKVLVAAKSLRTVISSEVLECPFVRDSQDIQRIGSLHYQRKLLKSAEITFDAPGTCLALQPDDVVTINNANYGGNYPALINSMKISKDLTITFGLSVYSDDLDDWEDLAPSALTVPSDDTAYAWQPALSGPQTDQDIGRSAFDIWGKEYLTVGPIKNQGKETDLQKALNAVSQAGGGAIYILNGDYQMTAPLYVPNVNLEVVGQSQGGVVLKNNPGNDLLVAHNLSKSYSFNNLTINIGAGNGKGFNIYGDTNAQNTANVFITKLITISIGDEPMIYIDHGQDGKITIKENKYSGVGGKFLGYDVTDTLINNSLTYEITNNEIFETVGERVALGTTARGASILFKDNIIRNSTQGGMTSYGVMLQGIVVCSNNVITLNISDINMVGSGAYIYPLTVGSSDRTIVSQNTVTVDSDNPYSSNIRGIQCSKGSPGSKNIQIIDNNINIAAVATASIMGLAITNIHDGVFSKNGIRVQPYSGSYGGTYGMRILSSNRNVVSGNNVELTDEASGSAGTGIEVGGSNNQGSDNITYNCNTGIYDSGTGNNVTGKDV